MKSVILIFIRSRGKRETQSL